MRWIALIVCLGVAGCAGKTPEPSGADVALRATPTELRPGATVELLLSNPTDARVGYNLCTSALQRQEGGEWQAVPSDRVCTMELRTLEPGDSANYSFGLPTTVTAGTYRFAASVEMLDGGERAPVYSNSIRVVP